MKQLDKNLGMQIAVKAYQNDGPVIVFSSDGFVVHGEAELRAIRDLQVPLESMKITLDVTAGEWTASEWPEIFEAARQLWLQRRLPKVN